MREAPQGRGRPYVPPVVADVDATAAAAREHSAGRQRAKRTLNGYKVAFGQFERWCAEREVLALPASGLTVAAYYSWLASDLYEPDAEGIEQLLRRAYEVATIRSARCAIRYAHVSAGHPSPTDDQRAKDTLRGIAGKLGRPPKQKRALEPDLARQILRDGQPTPGALTARNRAALLLAHATGLSLQQLTVPLRDVVVDDTAVRLTVGGGRQFVIPAASGPPECCPVSAVRSMLAQQPTSTTFLFGFSDSPARGRSAQPAGNRKPTLVTVGASTGELRNLAALLGGALKRVARRAGVDGHLPYHLPLQLNDDQVRRMAVFAHRDAVTWWRDRAAVLVAWRLALRASDLTPLQLGTHVHRRDAGYLVLIAKSKTDPHGETYPLALAPGRDPQLCAVRALDDWLWLTGRTPDVRRRAAAGFVFCKASNGTPYLDHQVAVSAITNLVNRATSRAGLDAAQFGAHSMRVGFVVTAKSLGATHEEVMTVGRWKGPEMVDYYDRNRRPSENAVRKLFEPGEPGPPAEGSVR